MFPHSQQLTIVVPVRSIDAPAFAILAHWAREASCVAIIAIGQHAALPAECPGNLTILRSAADLYGAMNQGLAAATTRFVLFMGIDDHLLTRNVSRVVQALADVPDQTPLVVLPFRIGRRQRTLRPVPGRLVAFHHQGVLFNRLALLDAGGYSAAYRMHSDLDAMFRLQRFATPKLLPVPLVEFRFGGMSTSGRNASQSFREITAIYKAHGVSRLDSIYIISVGYLLLHRARYLLRQATAS